MFIWCMERKAYKCKWGRNHPQKYDSVPSEIRQKTMSYVYSLIYSYFFFAFKYYTSIYPAQAVDRCYCYFFIFAAKCRILFFLHIIFENKILRFVNVHIHYFIDIGVFFIFNFQTLLVVEGPIQTDRHPRNHDQGIWAIWKTSSLANPPHIGRDSNSPYWIIALSSIHGL